MKYDEWLVSANNAVNAEIWKSYASEKLGGWSENYITTRVLGAIEDVGTELVWEGLNQKIAWEGYKLTGANETKYGDIAVFVRVSLLNDRFIEGVAFYEAKRQYFDRQGEVEGFKSVKAEQFSRISRASSASNVLLYDVDPRTKRAYAGSIPTEIMKELTEAGYVAVAKRAVHGYGESWLSFLGANFKGFGLDFAEAAVQSVKELAQTADAPFTIMNVAVGKAGQNPSLNPYFSQLPNYEQVWGLSIPSLDNEDKKTNGGPKI